MLSITKRNKNGGGVMKKNLFASLLMVLIGGVFASSVIADDTFVRFRGAAPKDVGDQDEDGAPKKPQIDFDMVVSPNAAQCLREARAHVRVAALKGVERVTVWVSGLPP